ncbi:MAG: DUF5682 family protein [Solirubrobacteraceae bacterium]|nr:DUF5682 family protein [Solirubrobacteraceae bacterium]
MTVTVLGVRHHGPGSARAVRAALTELAPDAVLIEGPPEADAVASFALDPSMQPPVALLVHATADPGLAAFYPFASFSPEWIALRHGLAAGVPVRFIDLPATHGLALLQEEREGRDEPRDGGTPGADTTDEDVADSGPAGPTVDEPTAGLRRTDPIALLAEAAGHDDPERWWDDAVEHGTDGALDLFAAISQAMAELRRDAPEPDALEVQREAAMRRAIRRAEKDGYDRIAVVCGAWHAPVLERDTFPPASQDDARLKGLPKVRTTATWVPWTHDRLSISSGYGAGVDSPGWYHHLFEAPDAPVVRWLQRTAALLRGEGLDASPASVVEATRLAEALGHVRSRPLPGLSELRDASLAVLCHGNPLPLRLIDRRLVVGEVLGTVPDDTPMVPLSQDLAALQRSLRLPAEASVRHRELDLRKDLDLRRSHLLHRLVLLGIPWGVRVDAQGATTGTFKEPWQLEWQPEFAVRLIEASRYGATVEAAATQFALERGRAEEHLGHLAASVEACLLAALPDAVAALMRLVADRAATDGDLGELMDALEPLAGIGRYGSVRRDDTAAVEAVVDGLAVRVCLGLAGAAGGLDDEAAAEMVGRIDAVDRAFALPALEPRRAAWRDALDAVAIRTDVRGTIAGRATRLLLDARVIEAAEARRRLSLELSRVADADRGAAWIEGFLSGTGLVLLHDPDLLGVIDQWLTSVPAERFNDLLPVLRRAFARFPHGELRQIGAAIKAVAAPTGARAATPGTTPATLDLPRAEAALATTLELLG